MHKEFNMKDEFTTSEYIQLHQLPMNAQDPRDTRILAQHLRTLGYKKKTVRRGNSSASVWFKAVVDDERRAELQRKLKEIEEQS
jgi:hypothetical protein